MNRKAGLAFLSCFLLFGCQAENETQEVEELNQIETPEIAAEGSPSFAEADTIENRNLGQSENLERFQKFLTHVNQKEADLIRIVSYTTEGDAIYQDLHFDGKAIISTIDSTRDQYGPGAVTETSCMALRTEESAESVDYYLEGCENQEENFLLTVEKASE